MRRFFASTTLAAALSLSFAPLALAQDHPGHGVDTEAELEDHEHGAHGGDIHFSDLTHSVQFWGAIVNFALLLVVLVYLGKKPLSAYLTSRRKTIEDGLSESARLKKAAEDKYAEYTARLEQLDKELDTIRAEMIKAGEAERDRIVADAEEKAARVRRETDFIIEQQMKQIREDLTHDAVAAAVKAATEVLREQTSADDQQRLAGSYLDHLKEQGA